MNPKNLEGAYMYMQRAGPYYGKCLFPLTVEPNNVGVWRGEGLITGILPYLVPRKNTVK